MSTATQSGPDPGGVMMFSRAGNAMYFPGQKEVFCRIKRAADPNGPAFAHAAGKGGAVCKAASPGSGKEDNLKFRRGGLCFLLRYLPEKEPVFFRGYNRADEGLLPCRSCRQQSGREQKRQKKQERDFTEQPAHAGPQTGRADQCRCPPLFL